VVAGRVGAAAIVENIFGIPGLGSEIVDDVNRRDYSVLQAIVLILAVLVLVLNLAADLLIAVIDPRVQQS
jgi:peptide/nickel transport system permease protein